MHRFHWEPRNQFFVMADANSPQLMQSQQIKKQHRARFGFTHNHGEGEGEENAAVNPGPDPPAEQSQMQVEPASVEV